MRRALFVLLVACNNKHATHATSVTLDGMRVEITLPDDMRLDAKESDEKLGMVAFDRERDHPMIGAPEQAITAFLTGTRNVTVQASLSEAVTQARVDFCDKSTRCDELSREALPSGGFLVTVRNDKGVQTVVTKAGSPGRAFVCGAAASTLFVEPGKKTWLDDAAEIKKARDTVETICRSAHTP